MKKQTLSAEQLHALILDRIAESPKLMAQVSDIHKAAVVVAPHGGDEGANWTVRSRTNRDQYRPDLSRVIRALQRKYDLDVNARESADGVAE